MSQYFPKPYKSHGGDIKVKLDLSDYATRTDLKNVTHLDVRSCAPKASLASLKTEGDEIDGDKLKTIPVDLAKLRNVVKNDVVKKMKYNSLKTKVDSVDTTNFVSRTKYEKDGSDFEGKSSKIDKKISDVSDLVKKTDFNAKITDIEGTNFVSRTKYEKGGSDFEVKISKIGKKISNVSDLVKKNRF